MLVGINRRPRSMGAVADTIASAIYRQEGAVQNNNPGNLMYAGQPGATGADSRGFAKFSTLQQGQAAEVNQINLDITRGTCATGAPVVNLSDLISCLSPPSQNDTPSYINNVSAWTGIDPNVSLQSLNNVSVPLPVDLSPDPGTAESGDAPDYTWAYVAGGAFALWWALS